MSDSDNHSRLNKFDKRRKNTKAISIFLVAGALLLIILLAVWLFGGNDETAEDSTGSEQEDSDFLVTETEDEDEEAENNAEDDSSANDDSNQEESAEENESGEDPIDEEEQETTEEDIETEPAEPSDNNVAEAYSGNWDPIGTEQTGPHTTNFDDGSDDRIEVKRAAAMATGIAEDDMIVWWVDNGGEQKVIATVSDKAETDTYRVFMDWIDGEGWQPKKIEVLIENDKK
ncbi:YrrS family protein [Oceanobacillus massiliensis]|uniref:YrrS family protein n=1 Tax=Oceanobacillus massiliensis TaxID=1465765 RepID=UPI0002882B6E|nr:YrrS family protein [Oceanobacillus massiliensis]